MAEQTKTDTQYTTLEEWIQQEVIPFSVDSDESLNAAIDQLITSLDDSVELLGLGEPTHMIEDFLILRNRLFQRLVEAHGYTAIAIESSFPKSHLANAYITGQSAASLDEVLEKGFSHNFGRMPANRALIEWMRQYNADPVHQTKIHFYGFDSPTEMYGTDSPRQSLEFVLDYLESVGMPNVQQLRQRIDALIGEDAAWENPETLRDSSRSIGLSPAAVELRIETEELITDLLLRRPQWVANGGQDRFLEAVQFATVARQLLTYHAGLARETEGRFIRLMEIRDAMMADILSSIVLRERSRGKVLAFAHNSHLKRGRSEWLFGEQLNIWWPAGAHLADMLGERYVMIGVGVGASDAMNIGQPEPATLEAALTASAGPVRFIPTHSGEVLPAALIADLPTRSATPQYFPLDANSFTDYDWLCVLDTAVQFVQIW